MGKPTDDELKVALAKCAELREKGQDEFFLAKSLFSLDYRHRKAVQLIDNLKRYFHSGTDALAHGKLTKELEEFEKVEYGENADKRFGL